MLIPGCMAGGIITLIISFTSLNKLLLNNARTADNVLGLMRFQYRHCTIEPIKVLHRGATPACLNKKLNCSDNNLRVDAQWSFYMHTLLALAVIPYKLPDSAVYFLVNDTMLPTICLLK